MTDPTQGQVAQEQEFKCPQCGGKMGFDAATSMMKCQYCEHTLEVGASEGVRNIVEYDLEHGLAAASKRGFGTESRTRVCQECGASVSFDANVTSTQCEFCGSAHVLDEQAQRNIIRPESLVPFHVDEKVAKDKFKGWLNGLWFRPSALKSTARVDAMAGVYVPYWTFDANVDSSWTAQSGWYYYETETYTETDSQGNTETKTRQVQRTRWEPSWGSRSDFFDDTLVCASKGLPTDLAEKLKTFDTGQLVPYEPGYLAGWRAEEYAVDLNEAWKRALNKMENVQERRCAGDVPGDTHRFLSVDNRFYNEKFKHVLLPLWISSYRFNEKVYRFLVNGQTGEVTGKAPYSILKILLFVAAIAAIIATIVILVTSSS